MLRAIDGRRQVSPCLPTRFSLPRDEASIVHLDRLSRALHVHNFCSMGGDSVEWLFLNVDPRVIVQGKQYGTFSGSCLRRTTCRRRGSSSTIMEGAIDDELQLAEFVGSYKDLSCLVAIDDFGAGQSNSSGYGGYPPTSSSLTVP